MVFLAFYETQVVDMFLGFVDTKLISLVPDLIGMPEVTLKPVIYVVYYAILYHGSAMPAHRKYQSGEEDYPTLAYTGCLRALSGWQREATGSRTDFVAAILMVSRRR